MALFTPQEASGTTTTITKCKAQFADSGQTQHMYYIFGVTDDNGKVYDWKDKTLEAGADVATIKTAIYDKLLTMHKKAVNAESTMNDDGIVGSNPV